MELELHEINVKLSKDQKQKIRNAFINREKIILRLSIDALRGRDTLLVPTNFFGKRDSDDPKGFSASVDEQTFEEMNEEIRYDLKLHKNTDFSGTLKNLKKEFGEENSTYEKFKVLKSLRDLNLSDEMLNCEICQKMAEYYGLFFDLGIDYSKGKNKKMEYEGVEELREKLQKGVEDLPRSYRKEVEDLPYEVLEARIEEERETNEHKGIEFTLNYSLVNDLAKDFVKDNIKKLFE